MNSKKAFFVSLLVSLAVGAIYAAVDLCSCHDVPKEYDVQKGKAIALPVAAEAILSAYPGYRCALIHRNRDKDLGVTCFDDEITFTIEIRDPDTHVCDGRHETVYAYLDESHPPVLVVSGPDSDSIEMTKYPRSKGKWHTDWKPTQPGKYNFKIRVFRRICG